MVGDRLVDLRCLEVGVGVVVEHQCAIPELLCLLLGERCFGREERAAERRHVDDDELLFPLLAAAADVLLALDVELFAAGALELDVNFEVLLEPQPMAARLRTQTIMASRVRDRAVV